MWEVVFLSVFARVGSLQNEVLMPNGRRPDFIVNIGEIALVGDITTISDAGLEKQNPLNFLWSEVARISKKYRINPNWLSIGVGGDKTGLFGNYKTRLLLPDKSKISKLVNGEIISLFKFIRNEPGKDKSVKFEGIGYSFSIKYTPGQQFSTMSHPAYKAASSLIKNPMYGALKSKVDQLRDVADGAIRTIIICDGGSESLNRKETAHGIYSTKDIAKEFLRQYKSIDIVLIVTIICKNLIDSSLLKTHYEIIRRPLNEQDTRLTEITFALIERSLEQALSIVPQPVQLAVNAALRAEKSGVGPDMIGGYTMSRRRIKISVRAVQRLFAGEITPQEFANSHDWDNENGNRNPFYSALKRGEMINSARLESAGDKDDDWIEFQFAKDPAVSDFSVDG